MRADDRDRVAAAVAEARRRTADLLDGLQATYTDIVDAAEMSNNDDEHDPDGSTVAYERAQVWALMRQARADLAALDEADERLAAGTIDVCRACGGAIGIERLEALPHVTVCVRCRA